MRSGCNPPTMENALDDLSGGAAEPLTDDAMTTAAADAGEPQGPLTTRAMTTLRAFFDAAGHNPSVDHWRALEAIASTMEDMADGCCERRVFLSAVDPGVGKSSDRAPLREGVARLPCAPQRRHDDLRGAPDGS